MLPPLNNQQDFQRGLDRTLFNRDQQKPLRSMMDNYILPTGQAVGGGALALIGALSNIKREPRMLEIK